MIINLTQHIATPEQIASGVIDLPPTIRAMLTSAITFDSAPSLDELSERAEYVAGLAVSNGLGGDEGDDPHPTEAMIGGAPFFMGVLESALMDAGIRPVYAFSARVSVERVAEDGTVSKASEFRHMDFVRPYPEMRVV